jgi:hypothetical protein
VKNRMSTYAARGCAMALAIGVLLVAPAVVRGQAPAAPKDAAPAAEAPLRPASFDGMDRNADGKVSEEEYRNAMAFVFAAEDTNHDGVLTRAEAQAAGPRALRKFEAVDAAKAGKTDLAAFLEISLSIFHAADTDGDGFMSRAERDEMRAKVRAARDAAASTPKP